MGIVLTVATLTILLLAGTWPDRVHGQEDNPPARPTGLTGTVRHDRVALTWDDSDDDTITGYQILRRDTTEHQPGEFIILLDDTAVTDTSYNDTTVEAGTFYVYRIKARNANGLSPRSGYFDARVPLPPQVTVTFEQATYSVTEGGSVTITVQLDQDPQRDVVIEVTDAGQNGADDADYSGVPESVAFADGQTSATFTIAAADDDDDDDGESILLSFGSDLPDRVSTGSTSTATVNITDNDETSEEEASAPARPTGLTGTVRHDRVALTWDDPGDDSITSYQVLRRDTTKHQPGEFIVLVDNTGSAATTYTDATVTAGVWYVYRINARNGAGLSPQSGYFNARVPLPPAVVVSFAQSTYAVAEGESVTITVRLDQDPQREVAIELDDTAQNGATDTDYSGLPENVDFGDGQTTATFTITAAADEDDDDGESVMLSIGSNLPDRVSTGSASTTTVAITAAQENAPATGVPTITGTTVVGETLQADTSGIADADGISNAVFAYQWIRNNCGVDREIANGTNSTYSAADADRSHKIKVRITFEDDDGYQEMLTSEPVTIAGEQPTPSVHSITCVTVTDQNGSSLDFGAFAPETTSYSVSVASNVERVSVTVVNRMDIGTGISVLPGTGDDEQIDLAYGTNHIVVASVPSLIAPDISTYTIAITRSGSHSGNDIPTVSIHGISHPALEGASLPYVLTRTADVSEPITVSVNVTESGGDVVSATNEGQSTVTFAAGHASALFSLPTNADDTWEEHSTVKVEVVDGDNYDVSSSTEASTVSVESDDAPPATAVLSIDNHQVSEGDTITATVTVTTNTAQAPNSSFPNIMRLKARLGTGSGAAELADITSPILNNETITLTPFKPVMDDGVVTAYQFTYSATISIVDDDLWENDESFEILIESADASLISAGWASPVNIEADSSPQTITILEHEEAIPTAPEADASTMTVVVEANDDDTTDYTLTWNNTGSCTRSYRAFLKGEAQLYLLVSTGDAYDTPLDEPQFAWHLIGSQDASSAGNQLTGTLSDVKSFQRGYTVLLLCGDSTASPDPYRPDGTVSKVFVPYHIVNSAEKPKPGTYTSGPPLTGLTTSHGTLSPAFNANSLVYVIPDVPSHIDQITLTPTMKPDYTASWSYAADADDDAGGHQVDLSPGLNNLLLLVSTDGGHDDRGYRITVKRLEIQGINGNPTVGQTLTADTSDIDDPEGTENAVFTYQWVRVTESPDTPKSSESDTQAKSAHSRRSSDSESDIPGATGDSYTLTANDAGKSIKVRVPYTDDAGNDEEWTSQGTAAVETAPNNPATGVPTIDGSPTVGETLTADTSGISDADGLTNAAYSYQWVRNDGTEDSDISNATGNTYTLVEDDEAKTIKVRVSFTDEAGNEETLTSAATAKVAPKPNTPATGAPTISGTLRVGQTLIVDTSGISDADGLVNAEYGANWFANEPEDTSQGGLLRRMTSAGTDLSYTVSRRDAGKTLKIQVYFTDDAGNPERLTSANTDVVTATVPAAPVSVAASFAVSGDVNLSWEAPMWDLLGESSGQRTWGDGGSPITGYVVQWKQAYRSWDEQADISEAPAVGTTHTITGLTSGTEYSARVIAVNSVGRGIPSDDFAFTANKLPTGAPTVSGTTQVSQTLTADTSGISDADGLTNATYSYQWVRSDGTEDSDISNATGNTYTLVEDDEDMTIKVRVSFTDDTGNDETLTSAATEAVQPVAEAETAESSFWSATMTTAELWRGHGYSNLSDTPTGSLTPDSFEVSGVTYTVKLIEAWGSIYIGFDQEMAVAFVLEVDETRLDSSDAKFESYSYAKVYLWQDAEINWSDKQAVQLRMYISSSEPE